jgi:hypothetical protein
MQYNVKRIFTGGWQFGMFLAIWNRLCSVNFKSKYMKKHLGFATIALSLFLVSFTPFYSIDDVVTAMRNGSASQLSKYFDARVDISVPGKSDNYSKSQAELILKDFFASNEVKGFQVKHKGKQNGSEFCIGVLQTRNGDYRTKFFMKKKGESQVVQELGFETME